MCSKLRLHINKTIIGTLLITCMLISSVVVIFSNNNIFSTKAEDITYSVTESNFEILVEEEAWYRETYPDYTAEELHNYLEGVASETSQGGENTATPISDDWIADIFYRVFQEPLTSSEVTMFKYYPIRTIIAFVASGCAKKASAIYYSNTDDKTNANAFKHAYWNALMVRRLFGGLRKNDGLSNDTGTLVSSAEFAEMYGDAHEYGETGIVSTMDLENNRLGRIDGENFSNLSEQQLALKIIERISLGNYYRVVDQNLIPTDWTDLRSEYFNQLFYETTSPNSDEIIITQLKGDLKGALNVESSINGKTLVGIGDNAFENRTNLTSVTLPDTVTSIGAGAFSGCTGLTSINIPEGVTTIGANAFAGCTSLTSITIPESVTSIGESAFSGCSNLQTIHIYGTPIIENEVFKNCLNLDQVYFYSYLVRKLGENAFPNIVFELYVPHCKQSAYSSAFAGYNVVIDSIDITVTLKLNGDDNEPEIINTHYGAKVSSELDPFRIGYIFNHWIDDDGNVYKHGKVWDSTENLTVTAVWTARQSYINFVGYGTEGVFDKLCTYDQPIGEMPVPNVEGQTFVAWRDDNGFYYYADTVWDMTGNLTLKAVFEGVTENPVVLYYVDLDQDGGQGGTDNLRQEYLMPMFPATAPEREGYSFDGYYTQQNGGGVQYYDGGMTSVRDFDINSNTTLYAKWTPNEYTLTVYLYNNLTTTITATYGQEVTAYSVPGRTNYELVGYYTDLDGLGECYIGTKVEMSGEYYLLEMESKGIIWDVADNGVLYAHWQLLEIDYTIPVYGVGEGQIYSKVVHLVSGESITLAAGAIDNYTFSNWTINGENFTTEYVTYTFELHRSVYTNEITIYTNNYPGSSTDGAISLYFQKNECVAAGTLITLADGRQVPVETLTGNEMLLVWNLHTGSFDVAPILFIDSDALANYKIINLYFSDGTHVKVIDEHAFWDFNLNKYVYLREDASQYIGHWFNKQITDVNGNMAWTRVQLTNVTITEETTTAWSPVTYGHLCLYVNGMLSMPGGIEGLVNTFAVDGNTMRINQAQYLADITTYGLFTYAEFAEICPVPENIFNAVQGQYLKVAIGKGYIDYETLGGLIERYAEFF